MYIWFYVCMYVCMYVCLSVLLHIYLFSFSWLQVCLNKFSSVQFSSVQLQLDSDLLFIFFYCEPFTGFISPSPD